MRFRAIATLAMLLLSLMAVSAKAQQVEEQDLTAFLKKNLEKHFIGYRAQDGPTVIERHGNRYTGYEVRATGSASVDRLDKFEGVMKKVILKDYNIDFITGDIKMVWHYSGETQARNIARTGGAFVGYSWKKLHPTGTIHVSLIVERQRNGQLKADVRVDPGHGDRPNNYIKDHIG